MGEWDWQALQLDTTRASLYGASRLALTQRTHDRASLHGATRLALTQRTHDRASLQGDVSLYYNGRTTVRPYMGRLVSL